MDVNYSRWMSKDPDAEPEVIEDEPSRFGFPRPGRSVVASGAMVALIALGGAVVRSTATPKSSSTGEDPTVATITADEDPGPGVASVEDATDDSTSDSWTSDGSTPDSSADEESTASDDEVTAEDERWVRRPAPAGALPGRPRMDRRELGPPNSVPPGAPSRGRALHVQMSRH